MNAVISGLYLGNFVRTKEDGSKILYHKVLVDDDVVFVKDSGVIVRVDYPLHSNIELKVSLFAFNNRIYSNVIGGIK